MVTYYAINRYHVQSPVFHKVILKFVESIDRENTYVSSELKKQQRNLGDQGKNYQLRLPDKVEALITPGRDKKGRPIYEYHDLLFELDKDEIQQLLMGESLYGDPTLCLRELIQNSLDALQMRDLRLKVLDKDLDARVEPTDPLRRGEELHVKVTWGRDLQTDREYIRVWDNGCGMTRDVLKRYFTKLGKSYYRSPEYERERQILREHGFIVSPISQFGIGFLSCFMLADEIQLRTRPGGKNDGERNAYNVRISGPGSLFWLSPGTLERQGTEITVYLKRPFQLDNDRERAIGWLRAVFGYSKEHERNETQQEWQEIANQKRIDPLWIIGRHVVWPIFPINMGPEGDEGQFTRLDDRFHLDMLEPIAINFVKEMAAGCDLPAESLGQPRWECMDWEDNSSDKATGTRIRLIFPYHQPADKLPLPLDPPPDSKLVRVHELAALVEATLCGDGSRTNLDEIRKRLTIKGITVNNLSEIYSQMLPITYGVGTILWVDLRGDAAPRLTADRKTAMLRDDIEDLPSLLASILQGWCGWLQSLLDRHSIALASGLLSAFAVESEFRPKAPATPKMRSWQLKATHQLSHQPAEWIGRWFISLFLQEISTLPDFSRSRLLERLRSYGRNLAYINPNDLYGKPGHTFTVERDLACNLVQEFVYGETRDCYGIRHFVEAFFPVRAIVVGSGFHQNTPEPDPNFDLAVDFWKLQAFVTWTSCLALHLLPEAFSDDLSRSLPALNVCGLRGRAGDGWLIAPAWIEWDVDPVTAEVRRDNPKEQWSRYLIKNSYDLVFPLTNVPLGQLRRDCPAWRSDPSLRALMVFAFMLLGAGNVLREKNDAFREFFGVDRIHALMPKPDLWLKPFDDWTETDWKTCGLSALWDIKSGCVYWAEGAHSADDMPRMGKLIDEFIASATKAEQGEQEPTNEA